MEKTLFISIRDMHKEGNNKVSFITEETKIYNENNDTVIWDDTNGVAHIIRINDDYRLSQEKPFIIESIEYDVIKFVSSSINTKRLKDILVEFINDSIITQERGDNILSFFRRYDNTSMPSPGTEDNSVVSVKIITELPSTIYQGEILQLEADVKITGIVTNTITWSTDDDTGKVTIDETGLVNIAADAVPGEYNIKATSNFKSPFEFIKYDIIKINVLEAEITSVDVTPNTYILFNGETLQLEATANHVGVLDTSVIWSSSDPNITVNENGLVTVDEGTTPDDYTITATSVADPTKSGICTLTIYQSKINDVVITPTASNLYTSETLQLNETVYREGPIDISVTWTSSDPNITVDENGLVTVGNVDPDDYTITATSVADPTKSGTCTLTVLPSEIVNVSVEPSSATVYVGIQGQSLHLQEIVVTHGIIDVSVSWSTSSTKLVVGELTEGKRIINIADDIMAGNYVIIATSVADNTKIGSCSLTVEPLE